MIGLMVFGIAFAYIGLSIFIIDRVYKKYGTKKAKHIATAIMVLIPTWDVILGFPVYAYLCLFESGSKIYKTVDNVEGFYVGERSDKHHHSIMPYEGYRFIEYKGRQSGKYFRNEWLDGNTSAECIQPDMKIPLKYNDYLRAFQQGKCLAHREIGVNELNPWEVKYFHVYLNPPTIYLLNIYIDKLMIVKQRTDVHNIYESYQIRWQGGWLYGLLSSIEMGHPDWFECQKKSGDLSKTLKVKKESDNG